MSLKTVLPSTEHHHHYEHHHAPQPRAMVIALWVIALLLFLLFLEEHGWAQGLEPTGSNVDHVICDSGCGSPPATADQTTFTAGSTNVTPTAGVFNDGLTNLTSGQYGAYRMTLQRALHVNLRDATGAQFFTAGNLGHVSCDSGCAGGASTPADTFATPTTAGLQMTFPMVWNGATFDRLYGDKTNGAFVNIKNSVALAVTGTFWQATQPISGSVTVTQATGTNLHTVCDSGCSSSTAPADGATFTEASTSFSPVGGYFRTSPTSLTTDHMGAVGMTATRHLFVNLPDALPAGSNVIGHVIADSGSTTAVTGNVAVTKADGSDVTLGAKADAKSTATDTTAITAMQVLKEISAMEQAPASRAVTNAGTFAVQATDNLTQVAGSNLGATAIVNYGSTPAGVAVPAVNAFVTNVNANGQAVMASSAPVVIASNQSAIAAAGQGATGSAVPTGSTYIGANGSGNLTGIIACDNSSAVNMVTATTTQIVAISGTAGRTYICSINLVAAGADNVAIVSGSGTNCASNLAGLAGGTTAATGWNFPANGGIAQGSGLGMIYKSTTTNNEICLITSAAVQLSGTITWTQF